jgi:hypothetical protein
MRPPRPIRAAFARRPPFLNGFVVALFDETEAGNARQCR